VLKVFVRCWAYAVFVGVVLSEFPVGLSHFVLAAVGKMFG
jgi:hypothetical protein